MGGVGWGVKTYTFLQADGKGRDGRIGIGMGPQIRALGRNPPHERSRGTQPPEGVRLCGPAYPKGVGVIQGGVGYGGLHHP